MSPIGVIAKSSRKSTPTPVALPCCHLNALRNRSAQRKSANLFRPQGKLMRNRTFVQHADITSEFSQSPVWGRSHADPEIQDIRNKPTSLTKKGFLFRNSIPYWRPDLTVETGRFSWYKKRHVDNPHARTGRRGSRRTSRPAILRRSRKRRANRSTTALPNSHATRATSTMIWHGRSLWLTRAWRRSIAAISSRLRMKRRATRSALPRSGNSGARCHHRTGGR